MTLEAGALIQEVIPSEAADWVEMKQCRGEWSGEVVRVPCRQAGILGQGLRIQFYFSLVSLYLRSGHFLKLGNTLPSYLAPPLMIIVKLLWLPLFF